MRWFPVLIVLAVGVAGCASQPGFKPAAPSSLQVSSPTIEDGGTVPDIHTCDGADRSPQIDVSNLPQGTVGVALIVDDPDAPRGTFVHWLVWDIPSGGGGAVTVPEGSAPAGADQGTNSADQIGYAGPCPPSGDGAHRYVFKAYAVDQDLNLQPGARVDQLESALEGRVLAWGQLTASYARST